MVFIAEVNKPSRISHYRPISLYNVLFKLIAKTIVNRVKMILPELVSPNQCSFISGRHITDNIVICQALIHSLKNMQ